MTILSFKFPILAFFFFVIVSLGFTVPNPFQSLPLPYLSLWFFLPPCLFAYLSISLSSLLPISFFLSLSLPDSFSLSPYFFSTSHLSVHSLFPSLSACWSLWGTRAAPECCWLHQAIYGRSHWCWCGGSKEARTPLYTLSVCTYICAFIHLFLLHQLNEYHRVTNRYPTIPLIGKLKFLMKYVKRIIVKNRSVRMHIIRRIFWLHITIYFSMIVALLF